MEERKLPLEIMESIINIVDDKKDLKACALSSSYFQRSCQSRLFQDFKISCDDDDAAFQEGGLIHTVVHTDLSTNVASFIRWLRIKNEYGVWGIRGGGKAVDYMLGSFIKKLTALEKLEVRGAGLELRHGEFVDGLITILQLPSLRELKLASLEHFPMPIILWGQSLRRVEFERVIFKPSIMSGGSKKPLISPSLEELKMDNRKNGLSTLGLHLLSSALGRAAFTHLKKLQLEYRDSEGDRPDDINRLLSACQSSLEDLVLFLTHDAYRSIASYTRNIRLSRMTSLRRFSTRVYITTRDGYLEEEHPFNFLRDLFLECSPTLESIHLLCFHRLGDTGDEDVPVVSGWCELDKVLTSLSGLREMSVVVCCTQCTPDQRAEHQSVYDLPMVRARNIAFKRRFTDTTDQQNINSALEQ